MKKVNILIPGMICPFLVDAQNNHSAYIDRDVFNVCASIIVVALCMLFILGLLKRMIDYRIKTKILEKGIPEEVISSILRTRSEEDSNTIIKWFAILIGLGIAFLIIYYTLPIGIHSLAILAFCMAGSFLGYFLYLKRSGK